MGFVIAAAVVIAYVVLMLLVTNRMKSKEKMELVEDKFIDATPLKKNHGKTSIILTSIALVITAVVTILAFMPWTTWNVDFFTKLFENIQNATLFGGVTYPIVFIGSSTLGAFGAWDLFTLGSFLMIMLFILKFVADIKLDDLIEGIGEGLKIAIKPAMLLAMVYAILVFSVSYPVLPGIINWFNNSND